MYSLCLNKSYKRWSIFRKSKFTSSCITGVHIFKLYHNKVWTLEQNTLHYFFTFWPRTGFHTFLMCSIKYQITLKWEAWVNIQNIYKIRQGLFSTSRYYFLHVFDKNNLSQKNLIIIPFSQKYGLLSISSFKNPLI